MSKEILILNILSTFNFYVRILKNLIFYFSLTYWNQ